MNKFIDFQKEFNKDVNEYAKFIDILFLLFCIIIPYFIKPIMVSLWFFSLLGLFYIRGAVKFRKQCKIYEEDTKTYREIINQHSVIFRNRNIR